MPFSFESPFALALLAAIPGAVWLARRSLSGLARGRRILAISLRSIILALVALALAGLRVEKISERIACVFIVDRSSSIPPDRREAMLPFVGQAVERSRARRPDDLAGVIAFGAKPGIEVSPRRDFFFDGFYTVIEPDATDIAGAIRLGAGCFPPGCARRIVLLTDGNETAGRAIEEARAAGARGIAIDVVPIRYAYEPEVRLEKLVVPEGIRAGEPFEVRAVVSASQEGTGTLRIFENGRIVESREVSYGPGRTVYAATLRRADPGAYRYEAQIEAEEDSLPANNLAHGFAILRGQPKVLLCAGGRDRGPGSDRLPAALRDEGIAVVPVAPGSLPVDPEAYIEFDALVLDDVHAADLGTERMDLIHGLVRDIGLGLVAVGGPDAFGAGGYGGTALEKALPVTMDLRGKRILPNGAIVLIFHTCEFPAGNDWAKKIAKAAIDVLSPRDLVGVLHYGQGEEWLFPLQPANPARMFPLIDGMFAGDMPDFDATLKMAAVGLTAVAASIRHIVIISDGDPSPPSPGVLSALIQGRITASTVFITSHGGVEAAEGQKRMQFVAGSTGGRFWPLSLGDVGKLPQIFIREATEVRRAVIVEEPFVPRVVQP
ncbi:MAG: VWA domain-containing protein, partial [Planctomycetes bacterium]|nr:VWA domain-containing protein [Planctomycetota bacterium]